MGIMKYPGKLRLLIKFKTNLLKLIRKKIKNYLRIKKKHLKQTNINKITQHKLRKQKISKKFIKTYLKEGHIILPFKSLENLIKFQRKSSNTHIYFLIYISHNPTLDQATIFLRIFKHEKI